MLAAFAFVTITTTPLVNSSSTIVRVVRQQKNERSILFDKRTSHMTADTVLVEEVLIQRRGNNLASLQETFSLGERIQQGVSLCKIQQHTNTTTVS